MAEVDNHDGGHKLQTTCCCCCPVGNILSLKLQGSDNYNLWKKVMLRFLESQDLHGYVDGTICINEPSPDDDADDENNDDSENNDGVDDDDDSENNDGVDDDENNDGVDDDDDLTQYRDDANIDDDPSQKIMNQNPADHVKIITSRRRKDLLVQAWILSSLTEELMTDVVDLKTAREVWSALEEKFGADTCQDKIKEVPQHENKNYLELYRAAIRADWVVTERFLERDKGLAKARINYADETILQVAVVARKDSTDFIKKLITRYMTDVNLEDYKDNLGNTVLHLAALSGRTELANLFITMDPKLLYIKNDEDRYPVHEAARGEKRSTLVYLLSVTRDEDAPYVGDIGLELLYFIITAEYFDLAEDLVGRYPHLATTISDNNQNNLKAIVEKRSAAFPSGYRFGFLERFIYNCLPVEGLSTFQHVISNATERTTETTFRKAKINSWWGTMIELVPFIKKIYHLKLKHKDAIKLVQCLLKQVDISYSQDEQLDLALCFDAMMEASRHGVHEVIEMIVETFPGAVYFHQSESRYTIFHEAIMNRCENVYNLVYRMGTTKYHFAYNWTADGNSLLHLCAKLAPPDKLNLVSGAALQMQRELQWFKEVEKFVGAHILKCPNTDNKTPQEVFTEEHKELKEAGEKWMRDTANSCIIAAALIATVVFAAAITVPGGNDDSSGRPKWAKEPSFIIFAVSDAISLFMSTTSLLLFVSLLTSRYAEEDFLYTLPKRLSIGLLTLFLSITFMMLAFGATLYLMFGENKTWVLIPVAALSCLPIASFLRLQFPLLMEVAYATYGPGIFGKQSDQAFY